MNTNKQKRRALCLAAAVIVVAVSMTGGNAQAKTPTKIYTCHDYVNLAREVGWSKAERANIKRIMYRESRCFARAWNKKDPAGGSFGLMQINGSNVGWAIRMGLITKRDDLFIPRRNMRVALELWKLYGWRPWRTGSTAVE